MKRLIIFFPIFITVLFFFPFPNSVLADDNCSVNEIIGVDSSGKIFYPNPSLIYENINEIRFSIRVKRDGRFLIYGDNGFSWDFRRIVSSANNKLEFSIPKGERQFNPGQHVIHIQIDRNPPNGEWDIYGTGSCNNIQFSITSQQPTTAPSVCKIIISPSFPITSNDNVDIKAEVPPDLNLSSFSYGLSVFEQATKKLDNYQWKTEVNRAWNDGTYDVTFEITSEGEFNGRSTLSCSTQFTVCDAKKGCGWITPTEVPTPTPSDPDMCTNGTCTPKDCFLQICQVNCSFCKPTIAPTIPIPTLTYLCDQLPENFRGDCQVCIGKKSDTGKIWTAVGCLPVDFKSLIADYVFKYGIGIAGGIAFLYFIYGCFLILTSAGNPEMLEEAKQIFTSSLAGLLLIIFSVFLLHVIGVDILKIPGFG